MLAVPGAPFDSDQHFFEFKWDGIRTQVSIEPTGVRLVSRNGIDITHRYPELAGLSSLPKGMVLDGELIAFRDGKPDLEAVLGTGRKKRAAPAVFVAFDMLFEGYYSLMDLPFTERRERLEKAIAASACRGLMLSEGVRGSGRALYQTAAVQGLEGVVGKKLSSTYAAGKRNGAWIKVRRRTKLQAVIIGFIEKGDDFQSLLVAANGVAGTDLDALRYVGRVGGGFKNAQRTRLNGILRRHPRTTPIIPCDERARWVEPEYYCTVSFADWTQAGMLRAPVFEGLIEGPVEGSVEE
jgi:bifunctional non-homologous end joining protein LigD